MALRDRPACLILTRQAVPTLDRAKYASAKGLARGAYVLAGAEDDPEVLLIATGSEVALCVAAYETLRADGVRARVISMPSWELFEAQDKAYRDSVLPPDVTARVVVEAAATMGWERYAGPHGTILGIDTFGLSAPGKVVAEHFGFEPRHVVAAARSQIADRPERARRPKKRASSPA
jgi:transketolase